MISVNVYTKPNCQPCKATKRSLVKLGLSFNELIIESHPDKVAYMKSRGHMSAPFVEVIFNGEVVDEWSGFQPDKLNSVIALSPSPQNTL